MTKYKKSNTQPTSKRERKYGKGTNCYRYSEPKHHSYSKDNVQAVYDLIDNLSKERK